MEQELILISKHVKQLVNERKYKECERLISKTLQKYPHSAIPQNLFGIVLEKENNHVLAMKHFRAGYDLDPTYLPCRVNMDQYGDLYQRKEAPAYFIEDCDKLRKNKTAM